MSDVGIAMEKARISLRTTMPHWKGSRIEQWIIGRGIRAPRGAVRIHPQLGRVSPTTPIGVPRYTGYAAKAARQITTGIVDIPDIARAHALAQRGVVTGAQLQAEAIAWEMTLVPRTTAQIISKTVPVSTAAAVGLKEWALGTVVGQLKLSEYSQRVMGWTKRAVTKPPPEFLAPITAGKPAAARIPWEVSKQIGAWSKAVPTVSIRKGIMGWKVKGKLPKLSDILKEERGTMRMVSLVETPVKAFEKLPLIAGVPKELLRAGVRAIPEAAPIVGAGAVLGVRAVPRAPVRKKEREVPSVAAGLGLDIGAIPVVDVGIRPVEEQKMGITPSLAQVTVQELRQLEEGVLDIPQWEKPPDIPMLPKPKRDIFDVALMRRALPKKRKPRKGRYELLYPVRGVKSALYEYVLGK